MLDFLFDNKSIHTENFNCELSVNSLKFQQILKEVNVKREKQSGFLRTP